MEKLSDVLKRRSGGHPSPENENPVSSAPFFENRPHFPVSISQEPGRYRSIQENEEQFNIGFMEWMCECLLTRMND